MAVDLGELKARLGLDAERLRAGAASASKKLRALSGKLGNVAAKAAKLGAAAGAAGIAIGAAFTKKGLDAVDAQAKLARSLGATSTGLRSLRFAAEEAGIETSMFEREIANFNRRLGRSKEATGAEAEAMDALGLSAEKMANVDIDERVAIMADRINEMGLTAAETSSILGDLGIRNKNMVGFFRAGGEAVRAARGEVEDLGLAISTVDAIQVEKANDAMARATKIFEAIQKNLAVKLAPVLDGISDLLIEVGKRTSGFGDIIDKVINFTIDAIGFTLDRFNDFKLGIQALSAITSVMRGVFLDAFAKIINKFNDLVNGIKTGINTVIEGLNAIPGVDIDKLTIQESEFGKRMKFIADRAKKDGKAAMDALHAEMSKPPPSEALKATVKGWQDQAAAAAEAAAKTQKAHNEKSLSIKQNLQAQGALQQSSAAKEKERAIAEAEAGLERLRARLRTETETFQFNHQQRIEQLRAAKQQELITEAEFKVMKEQLEKQHQKKLTQLTQQGEQSRTRMRSASMHQQLGAVSQVLKTISSNMDKENRTQFAIQKAASLSAAIISGTTGVARTIGQYPFPTSLAMAAPQAAAAAAQVASIASQTYKGGGGASKVTAPSPAASGAMATAGASPSAGQPSQLAGGTLVVQGLGADSLFTGESVQGLVQQLLDYQRQGGRIILEQ